MKTFILKVLVMATAVLCGFGALAENAKDAPKMPLAEARAQIGDLVANPSKIAGVMSKLSDADQATFVEDLNAAIAKLPGSTEARVAIASTVNAECLKAANKGNLPNVLASVFASAMPEALTVMNETYAKDLFNRNSLKGMSDEAYKAVAAGALKTIAEKVAGSDSASVRTTFAILMFTRASNGSPADLTDSLLTAVADEKARDLAQKEWIPAAMATGDQKSYDSMLAYSDAGATPQADIVIRLAGPQIPDALLAELSFGVSKTDDLARSLTSSIFRSEADAGIDRTVKTIRRDLPYSPNYRRGDKDQPHEPFPYITQKTYPAGVL